MLIQFSFSTVNLVLGLCWILALANPESGHFFGNLAKSCSGQISFHIWRMPVQLQCVQLITDITNTAGLLYIFIMEYRTNSTYKRKVIKKSM